MKRVAGIVQIFVVLFLFSSMLFLCGGYIYTQTRGLLTALPSMPENEKWVFTRGGTPDSDNEKNSLLIPVFIGFSSDGEFNAAPYQNEQRNAFGQQLEGSLSALFSGEQKARDFARAREKDAYVARLCAAETFIYACFYGDIPGAAVFPLLAKDYEDKSTGFSFYFNRIFVLPDENGLLYGVAFDSAGNITELFPEQPQAFNKEQLAAYTNKAELIPFDFDLDGQNAPVALFKRPFEISKAVVENDIDAHYSLSAHSEHTKKILSSLHFNPNNTNFYTMPNGSVSFVENTGEVKISKNGEILYTAADRGIPLSEFLGYYPGTNNGEGYLFSDYIYAVRLLANSLETSLFGGEASVGLTGVFYDETKATLEVRLQYFLSGVVFDADRFGILLRFADNHLVGAEINALLCAPAQGAKRNISQKIAYAAGKIGREKERFLSFCPVYVPEQAIYTAEIYAPAWALRIFGDNRITREE